MSARTLGGSGSSPPQLFLPFVTVEDRAQLQQQWRSSTDRLDQQAFKRAASVRKKLSLKVVDGRTLPIDWTRHRSLLELPLGSHIASDLDIQPADEPDDKHELQVIGPDTIELPERYDWSEKEIRILHEGLLEYSLNLLKSKGNAEEKYDILRWIWAPDVYCWVSRSTAGASRFVPIYRRQLPFTFAACCALTGYDAERLRSGLAYVLRPVLKQLGISTITSE